jgi:hypothetical protein
VSGHDFVYGELLIGGKGGRKQLLADYEHMHQARDRDRLSRSRLWGRCVSQHGRIFTL